MSALQDSAMLVALNISSWSGRKFDRKATQQINDAAGAKDAGRFNKLLIAKEALQPIERVESEARQAHYAMTLPWGNNGERIMPAALFLDYAKTMGELKNKFQRAVSKFRENYNEEIVAAKQRLGALYDPSEYPPVESLRDRFAFETQFTPMPSAKDFRVQLSEDHLTTIKEELEGRLRAQQAEAEKALKARCRETLQRFVDVCSAKTPRIYDSLPQSIELLANTLPALNLSGDPQLSKLAQGLGAFVMPAEHLRIRKLLRMKLVADAERMLSELA